MAIIKKKTNNKCYGVDVKKKDPHTLLMGMCVGTVTIENSVIVV